MSPDGQDCYARSSVTVVLVDGQTGAPTRLPAEVRAAWKPYIEAPIEYRRR
jgi:acyl-CoA thioester hydrolase